MRSDQLDAQQAQELRARLRIGLERPQHLASGRAAVLFLDPAVGRFYKHDSPYTYFTSKDLHLGEISLECSRAGAAAAALWATLQCFPLNSSAGLGAILKKTREGALAFARLINEGGIFRLVTEPALDIVAYFPAGKDLRVSTISRNTDRIFHTTMNSSTDPVYLAKMILKPQMLTRYSDLIWDTPTVTVLRSVLMKPEHLQFVPKLYKQLANAATMLTSSRTAGS